MLVSSVAMAPHQLAVGTPYGSDRHHMLQAEHGTHHAVGVLPHDDRWRGCRGVRQATCRAVGLLGGRHLRQLFFRGGAQLARVFVADHLLALRAVELNGRLFGKWCGGGFCRTCR